jgi:hypothetical protein
VFAPIAIGVGPYVEEDSEEMGYWDALPVALPKLWLPIAASCLLAGALAVLTVKRQKRFGLGNQKTWAVFVLLFGVPGYLGYLCHRRWPVRELCGECEEPTPRDRDACAFCDAAFPAPEPKGTEVFA